MTEKDQRIDYFELAREFVSDFKAQSQQEGGVVSSAGSRRDINNERIITPRKYGIKCEERDFVYAIIKAATNKLKSDIYSKAAEHREHRDIDIMEGTNADIEKTIIIKAIDDQARIVGSMRIIDDKNNTHLSFDFPYDADAETVRSFVDQVLEVVENNIEKVSNMLASSWKEQERTRYNTTLMGYEKPLDSAEENKTWGGLELNKLVKAIINLASNDEISAYIKNEDYDGHRFLRIEGPEIKKIIAKKWLEELLGGELQVSRTLALTDGR